MKNTNNSERCLNEEFTKGIRELGSIYLLQELNPKEEKTIYLISVNLNKEENGIVLSVTDTEELIWRKEFNLKEFDLIRKRMGMEGSYQTYFELLKRAFLETKAPLSPEVYLEDRNCFLKIKYQISKGVTLSGNFCLEDPIEKENDPEEFHKIVNNLYLSSLRFSKNKCNFLEEENRILKTRVESLNSLKNEVEIRDNRLGGMTSTRHLLKEPEGLKKKKAKTDLVNPNTKKRRAVGLKFEQGNIKLNMSSDSD